MTPKKPAKAKAGARKRAPAKKTQPRAKAAAKRKAPARKRAGVAAAPHAKRPSIIRGNPGEGAYERKRFLSSAEIEATIAEVLELAEKQGVAAALIGGAAMYMYGSPRNTVDIDFAALEKIKGLKRRGPITFGGDFLTSSAGVPIDWIVRSDEVAGLYEEAVVTSRTLDGFPVVRPEFLAAIKFDAGRTRDHEDLIFLLQQPGLVDRKRTRDIIRRFLGIYGARSFDSVADEADWRASRGDFAHG